MSFRWQMIAIATACVLAFILISTQPETSAPGQAKAESLVAQAQQQAALEATRARQFVTHDRQLRERQEQLRAAEADLAAKAQAGTKMIASRQMLQQSKGGAWLQLITTNRPLYLALRAQAAKLPGGVTPCTICDGKSYLSGCVLCDHNNGKCPSCKGTGRTVNHNYCPVCVGSGKCFGCNGIGRMLCPFCDDGMIDVRRAPPATTIPIE